MLFLRSGSGMHILSIFTGVSLLAVVNLMAQESSTSHKMPWIVINANKDGFVETPSGTPFRPWGVNYDHDRNGKLLDEYWLDQWQIVEEDFREIRLLGANCVRVHLQYGKMMDAVDRPNVAALAQLGKLVELAERERLYLIITGLACYHKSNIPEWYDALDETERWRAQAVYWSSIAKTCKDSPAVWAYDLMNEPVLGGAKEGEGWLAGEPFGGKYFVQRIALQNQGRSAEQIAADWLKVLTEAIRLHDQRHLITVGEIPWAQIWPKARSVFHTPLSIKYLDFVSLHFYPERNRVADALEALKVYQVGKPIVIEEIFPLKCSSEEVLDFVRQSQPIASGWVSFYWGQKADELDQSTIAGKITFDWFNAFSLYAKEIRFLSSEGDQK